MGVKRAILLLLCPLLLLGSGCGLFYENSYRGQGFKIYSDRGPDFVRKVGEKVGRIYVGYARLFDLPRERLGTTTIVLEGSDTDEVEPEYSPGVLGYYVPLFNFISVDTKPAWARTETTLQQILLHEIAHHFVVTEHPVASRQCWLNEGLAGNLEMTLFEGDHFEYPLLNPTLFQLAQKTLYEAEAPPSLKEFVALGWGGFHSATGKERNYALAWSIVYFLLERYLPQDLPLGKRIERLYDIEAPAISRLQGEWVAFLRGFDLTGCLLDCAASSAPGEALTSRWAILQLGTLRTLDDLRVLVGLARLFDDPDAEKRRLCYLAFLQTLERNPHSAFLTNDEVLRGLERIGRALDGPAPDPSAPEVPGLLFSLKFPPIEKGGAPAVKCRALPGRDGEPANGAPGLSATQGELPTTAVPASGASPAWGRTLRALSRFAAKRSLAPIPGEAQAEGAERK